MTLPERVYRLALYACPEHFRDEFGEASVRDFVRLVDERRVRRDRLGVSLLCIRAVVDLFRTAMRERMQRPRARALPQNLSDARRNLMAKPALTLVVVMTLALGIGANSAIFDTVYEVTLKPLPFPDSSDLVVLFESDASSDGSGGGDVTPADFEDWRELNTSFVDLAAMAVTSMNLTGSGDPERVTVHRVSSSLFRLLGVEPAVGRAFLADEDRPGAARVVLLSFGFWQRRFGGDPDLLGRDIRLDDEPHRVIGVLPAWLGFPSRDTSMFVPLAMDDDERTSRTSHYLDVIGRLRPGVSVSHAAQEMDSLASRIAERQPGTNADNAVTVHPLQRHLSARGATPLFLLLVAVGAVFLIAVVNVANLLLARSAERQKEIAIRAALGASQSRILGQLMTESAVMAFGGASAGLLIALWVRRALLTLTPSHVVFESDWWRPVTIGFAVVLASVVTVVIGLFPARRLSRLGHGPLLALRSTRSPLGSRLRGALIVAEVAVALVLLIVGGLMARSFFHLTGVSPGFRTENVLTMRIELSGTRYREHHQKVAFYRELESRVTRLPGAHSAGFVTMLPLTFQGGSIQFGIRDRVVDPAVEPLAVFRSVSADYFRTLGIAVVEGRGFDRHDREDAPRVAVVNRALAGEYFPQGSAVGHRLDIWGDDVEIVGVVVNVQELAVGDEWRPTIYVASEQRSFGFFDPRDFAVHTGNDPMGLVSAVRAAVWSIDDEQPIASIRTMESIVNGSVAGERLQTQLLSAFGGVALLVAALGIYGVLSHAVSQRTDEIGVRMALGARAYDVVRMVAGRGLALAMVGIGLGLGGAALLGRFMESMLHGVEPMDIATIAPVTGGLALVALAACLAPAIRASRIDPLEALRED